MISFVMKDIEIWKWNANDSSFYTMYCKFPQTLSLYYLTKRRKRTVGEQMKYIVNFTVFTTSVGPDS